MGQRYPTSLWRASWAETLPHRTLGSSDSSPKPYVPTDPLAEAPTPWSGAKTTPCWSNGASRPPCTSPQLVLLTSLALVPGPASRAAAAARVPVTEAAVETPAAVLAAGSEAPWEALCRGGNRMEAPLPGVGLCPRTQRPPPYPCFLHPEPQEGQAGGVLVTLQARSHTPRMMFPATREPRLATEGGACQPRLTSPESLRSPLPAWCSPFSQARPVQPSGQVQWPEAGSQEPPFWQRQEC